MKFISTSSSLHKTFLWSLIDIGAFERLRLRILKFKWLGGCHSVRSLRLVKLLLEFVLKFLKLGASFDLVDHWLESELLNIDFLRIAFLIFESLLHTVGHFSTSVAFLSLLMNLLETSFFLHLHLLGIDLYAAWIWHSVSLEGRSLALGSQTLIRVVLLGHFNFVALPERERCLSLLSDLD